MTARRTATGSVAAAALLGAGVLAFGGGGEPAPAAARATTPGATATVERRDLVDRDELDGTLGYADPGTLGASAAGTLTRLRAAGAVVRRGATLYRIDEHPAAFLLYGRLPAWRDLGPGSADGADIRQLERNLRALGDDPEGDIDVDHHWDWATTAALQRFQDERGLTDDGTLLRGELVFRPGATRVGELRAAVGDSVAPGRPVAELSSTERAITVDLPAARASLARAGDRVTVELPTGRAATGRIETVGRVAEQPPGDDGGDPTIAVTIGLRGRAARGTGLDQAPVDVGFAIARRDDVLAVPVKALLARQGGGFAVELVARGGHRIVPVRPGVYADDMVEVAGDLRAGDSVVTAR
jgi:multidrug efflux pump subunit AcrA (membrane-fusion protein)